MTRKQKSPRILIIGANFAGLTAASKLSKRYDVTVIDARRDFQWTPNIHEILSTVKQQTSLSLNLETIIARLGHRFINQTVTSIDGASQTVTTDDEQVFSYDALLIASGQDRSNYGIKGAGDYAFGFRSADDVLQIRNQIDALLESKKKSIAVTIVGGGFTGVEVLGELLRKYAGNPKLQINVIDRADRLVSALPAKLSKDIVEHCKNHPVSFHFNKSITEVKKSAIHFADDTSIESDLTIWSAGTQLPEYLSSLETQADASGIAVNSCLQSAHFDNIFVAGDSAALPSSLPKQASTALDMGPHAAKNIMRFCEDKRLKPFSFSSKPVLLSLGDINTYFIQGDLVLASPALAAAKEAVYQFYMARLSSMLPLAQSASGLVSRASVATEKLLLAEVLKFRPKVLLGRSKVL